MDVEITPEPSEEERRAILAALHAERADPELPSPWRRAGLASEEDEDQTVAPPRHNRGATRA